MIGGKSLIRMGLREKRRGRTGDSESRLFFQGVGCKEELQTPLTPAVMLV